MSGQKFDSRRRLEGFGLFVRSLARSCRWLTCGTLARYRASSCCIIKFSKREFVGRTKWKKFLALPFSFSFSISL